MAPQLNLTKTRRPRACTGGWKVLGAITAFLGCSPLFGPPSSSGGLSQSQPRQCSDAPQPQGGRTPLGAGRSWVQFIGCDGLGFTGVWAGAANDVWLAAMGPGDQISYGDGRLFRWTGSTWMLDTHGERNSLWSRVQGLSGGPVYILNRRYDDIGNQLGIHVRERDGGMHTLGIPPIIGPPTGSILDFWVGREGIVWAVGWVGEPSGPRAIEPFRVMRSEGDQLARVDAPDGQFTAVTGVEQDVFVVGDVGVLQYSSGTWTALPISPPLLPVACAVSPSHVWFAAAGNLLQWDGALVTAHPTTMTVNACWGTSELDVWAVGRGGRIAHFDGTSWSDVPSGTTANLVAVSGFSSTAVWIAGTDVVLMLQQD